MVQRRFWSDLVENAWAHRTIVWLSGVRRSGKTVLSRSLTDVEYFDCELPSTRRQMADPEEFLGRLAGKRVVLDEIHRLIRPSELLKIAADHYPTVRILATGSSTLAASKRFRDTLAGRKTDVWLTPMVSSDLVDFGKPELEHRFLHGGLPSFFLSPTLPERDFQEWVDAYWSKDIAELFRLGRRASFQAFFELLLAQSGGIFEATRFAGPCEISRSTVGNYLSVLEATRVVHVVRPYSSRRPTEITTAPKVYGFDTGFVCYHRGWSRLRHDDLGTMWEHWVLNELHSRLQTQSMRYWRDKRGHEVDFVLALRGRPPIAIECKWTSTGFDSRNLEAFRRQHPDGDNWVVCHDVTRPFRRTHGTVVVEYLGAEEAAGRAGGVPYS
ncbi:MAG: ATP-binding protein [Candidatus Riflebacteria bacterium]|nr:ATP-binding protein [Candidatus Riflebacteria bacterium]